MWSKLKGFVAGFAAATVLMAGFSVYAKDVSETIRATFTRIKIMVNKEQRSVDSLVYNGNAYVKLTDIATLFNKELQWESSEKTAFFRDSRSLRIKGSSPKNYELDYYPLYNYLFVAFTQEMKALPGNELYKITLVSENKEQIFITDVCPGTTSKDALTFNLDRSFLKLNTTYTLTIPGNTLESIDGRKYTQEIQLRFRTPATVLNGKINANNTFNSIKSYTITGNGKTYIPTVYEQGQFLLTMMAEGWYTFKATDVRGRVFEKEFFIAEGFVNNIEFSIKFP